MENKENELMIKIQENMHKTLELINEQRLRDLRYSVSHNGRYPKTKYYEQDFNLLPWVNRNDFYWCSKYECCYKKEE